MVEVGRSKAERLHPVKAFLQVESFYRALVRGHHMVGDTHTGGRTTLGFYSWGSQDDQSISLLIYK